MNTGGQDAPNELQDDLLYLLNFGPSDPSMPK